MTEVLKENELNLMRVHLMSKGVKVVDTVYDHETPNEFRVDINERLTVHFHHDSEYHFESFCVNIVDIMDHYGKDKVLMYLLSLCDEYPSDRLSNEELTQLGLLN